MVICCRRSYSRVWRFQRMECENINSFAIFYLNNGLHIIKQTLSLSMIYFNTCYKIIFQNIEMNISFIILKWYCDNYKMNVWNKKQIRMMSNILNNPFLVYLDSGSYFLVVPLGNSSSSISYFHFTQVEIKRLRFKRANSFSKRNSSFRWNKKSVRSLQQQIYAFDGEYGFDRISNFVFDLTLFGDNEF